MEFEMDCVFWPFIVSFVLALDFFGVVMGYMGVPS
jgi:hypothetical protein